MKGIERAKERVALISGGLVIVGICLCLIAGIADAATFTVNNFSDCPDANPGNGACAASGCSGQCTLRAAIMEANALAGDDVITLSAGTYGMTIEGRGEDAAATGDLDITTVLTINGPPTGTATINAQKIDRILHVLPGANLTISDVTIKGGRSINKDDEFDYFEASGAGVWNQGTVTMTNSVVFNNYAHDFVGHGGGIFNEGTFTFNDGTVENNFAAGAGGIRNEGSMTVASSYITGNAAKYADGGFGNLGIMTISDSTISYNASLWPSDWYAGGGRNTNALTVTRSAFIDNRGGLVNSGSADISSSTFGRNTAEANGGAVYNFSGGIVDMNGCTLAYNDGTQYGAVYNEGAVNVKNSIIAGNSGSTAAFNSITSQGYNVIDTGQKPASFSNGTGDEIKDPRLGCIADENVVGRAYFPILSGSPAILAGDDATCPSLDQGNQTRAPNCDSGAAEYTGRARYSFVVMGDSRGTGLGRPINTEVLQGILKSLKNLDCQPKFILFNGDYGDSEKTVSSVQATLEIWKTKVNEVMGQNYVRDKMLPVFGSHERSCAPDGTTTTIFNGWLAAFNPVASTSVFTNCQYFNQDVYKKTVYTCDYENARFFVLNNDYDPNNTTVCKDSDGATFACDLDAANGWPNNTWSHEIGANQRNWIGGRIDSDSNNAKDKTHNFFIQHEPIYSRNAHEVAAGHSLWSMDAKPNARDLYVAKIKEKGAATMAFSAHEHHYARMRLGTATENPNLFELKTGTAGSRFYPAGTLNTGKTAFGPSIYYNYAVIDVDGSSVSYRVYKLPNVGVLPDDGSPHAVHIDSIMFERAKSVTFMIDSFSGSNPELISVSLDFDCIAPQCAHTNITDPGQNNKVIGKKITIDPPVYSPTVILKDVPGTTGHVLSGTLIMEDEFGAVYAGIVEPTGSDTVLAGSVDAGSFSVDGGEALGLLDFDVDGLLDSEEGAVDADGDELSDYRDPDTIVFTSATDNGRVIADLPEEGQPELRFSGADSILDVDASVDQTGKPTGLGFPYGLLKTEIRGIEPGGTVVLTFGYPLPVPEDAAYYVVGSWNKLPFLPSGTSEIQVSLTDGGQGDLDNSPDGTITHAGGLADWNSITGNPGFENGKSPWVFSTNGTGDFSVINAGGSKVGRVRITTPGTNVRLFQDDLTLEPNTNYQLSFRAYSNTGHDLQAILRKNGLPSTNYGLSKVINLAKVWRTFTVEFTTSGFSAPVNDGRLIFWLSPYDAAGDRFFFDNVVLTKTASVASMPDVYADPSDQTVEEGQAASFSVVATGSAPLSYQWQKNEVDIPGATDAAYTITAATLGDSGSQYRCVVTNTAGSATSSAATLTVRPVPVNLLTNGDFESGKTPWLFYTNGEGDFSVISAGGSNAGRVRITTPGTNVHLSQSGLMLEPNTKYRLSFRAYSNTGHDLQVILRKYRAPHTNYGLKKFINLTTSWQSYSMEFTTSGFSGTVNDGRLMFWLAPYDAAADQFFFDDVALYKIQ